MVSSGMPHLPHCDSLIARYRFGRDSFQEAMKLANKAEPTNIDWSRFKYMVFDIPNHHGTYKERYAALGKYRLTCL